jgi:hypothetical protein
METPQPGETTRHPDCDETKVWNEVLGDLVEMPAKQKGTTRAWAQKELGRIQCK